MTESGGGEGIEVVKNEPFDNHPLLEGRYNKGQYTYKKYHLTSKLPTFIRMMTPKGYVEIHEEAWNAYPYCRTVITYPGYKDVLGNFVIVIESLHLPDKGDQENVHELSQEKLLLREVVMIDIASDPISQSDYKPLEDPARYKSTKSGRGPLKGTWQHSVKPVMTCYKLVTVEFEWFGLQDRMESFIQKAERRLFTNFHRQVFCWIDKWHDMTMDDIRNLEERGRGDLDKQRKTGEARGMRVDTVFD